MISYTHQHPLSLHVWMTKPTMSRPIVFPKTYLPPSLPARSTITIPTRMQPPTTVTTVIEQEDISHFTVIFILFVFLASFGAGAFICMMMSQESMNDGLVQFSIALYGFSSAVTMFTIIWWIKPTKYLVYQLGVIALSAVSLVATGVTIVLTEVDLLVPLAHQVFMLVFLVVMHTMHTCSRLKNTNQEKSRMDRYASTMV